MDKTEDLSTIPSLPKELADIFAEESENDQTFHGFSENEPGYRYKQNAGFDDGLEAIPHQSLNKNNITSERFGGAQPFTLRVSLRLHSHTSHSNQEDGKVSKDEETEELVVKKKMANPRKKRRVKNEEDEQAMAPLSVKCGSDSEGDEKETFLSKRARTIEDNKAMLAQLMADLQKMPGGAGTLTARTPHAKKAKGKGAKTPRSGNAVGESRRNPERATRRQTRSMGVCEDPSGPRDPKLEPSLEDELLEVRHAPRRRMPRPSQTRPHVVRPVEDITEGELQLVADQMTEKVYDRVNGTTCHQCRQKTIDTKTCCRNEACRGIHGQFCGPCLKNRYGEEVKKALLDPEWHCPMCRGICNCSFCRQREGRCPTGILFPLAQDRGFSDVHSYLSSLTDKLKNGEEDDDL
ncbi:unnamed protein product [Arctogadus glacialis]